MNQQAEPPEPTQLVDVAEVAAALDRLVTLVRLLTPPGMSRTAASTLATLDRSGPCRLTALAAHERVTQPAMTQLISRLADSGLVARSADPADGRAVHVEITEQGLALLASWRAVRARQLSSLVARLSPADQAALAAALPAIRELASVPPEDPPAAGSHAQS
jgi:DNA-binding MarR family transcriptional regulator